MTIAFLLSLSIQLSGCNGGGNLPKANSPEYRNAITAFNVGLAALQATDDARAKEKLTRFTQLAPGEPAGWVNLGVLALRQQELDAAFENLEKARSIVPDNSAVEGMLGLVESKRGRFAEALSHLGKAVTLDPKNLRATYALALEIERQGSENGDAEFQKLIEKILEAEPRNLAAQLELIRIAAKREDAETVKRVLARLEERAGSWPPEIKEQFASLQTLAAGSNVRAAATQVAFLRNVLVRLPEYRQSLAAIKGTTEETGEPFEKFLKLPNPEYRAAPSDEALGFALEAINPGDRKWYWIGAISLDSESSPVVAVADGKAFRLGSVTLAFPGKTETGVNSNDILGFDYDYDFKTDLLMAGAGGLKLYRQESRDKFTDVTAKMKFPPDLLNGAYEGVWAADIDLDGDLDAVAGAKDGAPLVLRNNGDGTFKDLRPFAGVERLRGFVYADFDGDGDPDAALLDSRGAVKFFSNERLGNFRERALPEIPWPVFALGAADLNSDAVPDLLVMSQGFAIMRISDQDEGRGWKGETLYSGQPASGNVIPAPAGSGRLITADFDNNGGMDIFASTTAGGRLWLSDGYNKDPRFIEPRSLLTYAAADLTGDGRLDILGLDGEMRPVRLINRGSKNYHYQILRPRAAKSTGDQRINSFGIGGEIEVRSGLLYQKQMISSPVVHFGLGEMTQTDVARIIWPNGSIQGEFELKADQAILAEQRLKGSCPSLFAWNGESIEFVKDCAPWSPALGLHINAQATAGIQQTEEWMKIRGDQLAPRDGYYDLRITAELWETFYIDRYALAVVDHPADAEIFTDERFSIPPPKLEIYATSRPRPFARALDDEGNDVAPIVERLDDRYLDNFGRGRYQGVTRDHWVELEFPHDVPRKGPLWLIAHGFVHPTDGTVNIAMSQPRNYAAPQGLRLEIQDRAGNWTVANPSLGFPAGKKKTILIDITKAAQGGTPRRMRLRTNLELFWDKLEWAAAKDSSQLKITRVDAETAELRFRGFSTMSRANDSSPELPDYNRLEFTGQKWRDLIGYYTRYGDIRELLEKADDRFVIVNAGDEMRFRFKAPPAPPGGWNRDYVLIGSGWIKDGDYNSTFSKTVLPLPDRGMREYVTAPKRLEDDPVYQRFRDDWRTFHTRYVTPERFQNALRPKR